MKSLILVVAATLLISSVASETLTVNTCTCWEGYRPAKVGDSVQCVGIMLFAIRPCNILEPPRCVCGDDVTGILSDATGTWCSIFSKGIELKRWACENEEQWSEYKKKLEGESKL